ncbi:MAG: histidine phosphatase family protein [Firmicutes bacterium]|nr:histidine phosphatase family protein [Alicyclobacillaceae bacterium]MCL6498078.1 histidine phosphatase family protein [Bacillota bacterium]
MGEWVDVLLVRHGESEANAQGRFASRRWDPHLTAIGRRQAEKLVAQLEGVPIRHLVSSPLARARETLEPLARARGLPVTILADLSEVDLGEWDGRHFRELYQLEPFEAWRRDPERFPPPGGESILAVGRRVLAALGAFCDAHPAGWVVAATHADCLKAAVLTLLDADGPAARRLWAPNLGQLWLRYRSGQWGIHLGPLCPAALAHP